MLCMMLQAIATAAPAGTGPGLGTGPRRTGAAGGVVAHCAASRVLAAGTPSVRHRGHGSARRTDCPPWRACPCPCTPTDGRVRGHVAAAGDLANMTDYSSSSRVFVSANGDRPGRFPVVGEDGNLHGAYANLAKVVAAGAVVVADTAKYRDDAYNVGERELARWLKANFYHEPNPGSGYWIPECSALWWEECRIEATVSPAAGKSDSPELAVGLSRAPA